MLAQVSSLFRSSAVATALVFGLSAAASVHAQPLDQRGAFEGYGPTNLDRSGSSGTLPSQPGGGAASAGTTNPVLTPGYFEVVCPGGCYGGGFHWFSRRAFAGAGYYGFFRRYWGYGTYGPNYNAGPGTCQICPQGCVYVATQPGHKFSKHGGAEGVPLACAAPGGDMNPAVLPSAPSGSGGTGRPAEKRTPPTDNTAHLRLQVPENAEVLVEGGKTSATGTVRDFVSPPLLPGKNMTYSILVRYTDAGGKKIEETHKVRVRPNDQLDLDFARPMNAEQPPTATALRP
jgi:uncharacterized protein (TIGR03000 family)